MSERSDAATPARVVSADDLQPADPGDFLHVPPYAVHREANPGEDTCRAVIVRAGEGPPTINVDGPA